jgi:hypothetical protein
LAIAEGTGNVTFPVAAHPAPRADVVMNAGACGPAIVAGGRIDRAQRQAYRCAFLNMPF